MLRTATCCRKRRLAPVSSDSIFFLIILFDNPLKYNQKYHDYKGWSLETGASLSYLNDIMMDLGWVRLLTKAPKLQNDTDRLGTWARKMGNEIPGGEVQYDVIN